MDVRQRALRYGKECTNGYLELLEHVLLVSDPHPCLSRCPQPRFSGHSHAPATQTARALLRPQHEP